MQESTPRSEISSNVPDWSREHLPSFSWHPPRALLKAIRDYQRARQQGRSIVRRLAVVRHRFWSAVTGADIPVNSQIGGGLRIPHPNGIVILPGAVIGVNCQIFQQVTIGTNGNGAPIIGGHVDIGPGAKILGAVTIGDHAKIGANAVVLADVPAGATAVGIPARIIDATQPSTAASTGIPRTSLPFD